MSILNPKQLKQAAARSLDTAAYSPKKLALIHSGISAVALLIVSLLGLLLSRQIGATGGLSGMGLRAMLSTAQSTLSMGLSIAMPFWEMGLIFVCLQFARGENAGIPALAEGFRRFGPLLRLILLETVIFTAVIFVAAQISAIIFMMTPFSTPLAETMTTLLQTEMAVEDMMPLISAAIPLYLIMAVVCCVFLIPIAYRFRLAPFYLLSGSRRALVALGASNRLMTGNRLALFKVDLSFWWYYVAAVALALIANADWLFNLPQWTTFPVYLVYLAGQVLLTWQAGAYVQTTYAHAYETLKNADEGERPFVRNFPWGFLPDSE